MGQILSTLHSWVAVCFSVKMEFVDYCWAYFQTWNLMLACIHWRHQLIKFQLSFNKIITIGRTVSDCVNTNLKIR